MAAPYVTTTQTQAIDYNATVDNVRQPVAENQDEVLSQGPKKKVRKIIIKKKKKPVEAD